MKNNSEHTGITRETLPATSGNHRESLTLHFTYFTTPSGFRTHLARSDHHTYTDSTNASTSVRNCSLRPFLLEIALIEARRNANVFPVICSCRALKEKFTCETTDRREAARCSGQSISLIRSEDRKPSRT